MDIISELNDFINHTKEAREIKRALAVKMILEGKSYHEIKELLQVSHSFISLWKNQALFFGVESLKLQFKGTQGKLKPAEKGQVISWLREQEHPRLSDLKKYLEQEYKVIYKSNQSYYALMAEA
ncbi:helix-turn-helix domain-containing protein, partial [Ancylothrix sp. C2]|uniref:helix-turn-helix domain-containing protein n=1 Tax=Ancylothrix sp. D3o TaxID=2953691 RepID=UPI0021BAE975